MGEHQAEGEGRPTEFQMLVAPELEGGVYANFLGVWHTGHEFTLDFASTQPPQVEDPEDDQSLVRVPCRVVARVKVPVTVIFDVLRALNENMTRYETSFGEITRPGPPEQEQQE
jgi:Protein of unknown function (DUF3467)